MEQILYVQQHLYTHILGLCCLDLSVLRTTFRNNWSVSCVWACTTTITPSIGNHLKEDYLTGRIDTIILFIPNNIMLV